MKIYSSFFFILSEHKFYIMPLYFTFIKLIKHLPIMVGYTCQIFVLVNPWSLRQIRYFMYIFFKFNLILFVRTHAPTSLNNAFGWMMSYFPKEIEINSHLILSLFFFFLMVHSCSRNSRFVCATNKSITIV